MSVYKRGRFWHYRFEINGQSYRGTTRQTSKAKAEQYQRQVRDDITLAGPASPTIGECAVNWWNFHAGHLKSADNIANGLEICRRLIDFEQPVTALTTAAIAEAVARRRGESTQYGKAPSNATVNREIITVMRPIMRHASRIMGVDGIRDVDWAAVKLAKPKPKPFEYTAKQIEQIYEALAPKYHTLFKFYTTFGVRFKEAFFHPDMLDVENARIYLRKRKGDVWHSIPLDEQWARTLAALAGRARGAGLVTIWIYEEAGQVLPIVPRAYQSAMGAVHKRLGINAKAVHSSRHHVGNTAMRRVGNNITPVQKLLGHENPASTAVYAHADENAARAALGFDKIETGTNSAHSPRKALK